MADEDLRTFIRDITRRNERVFQDHLKEWEKMHEWSARINASAAATAKQLEDLVEESRAQRAGLFKLIDAIRDLEEGLGGSSAA